MVWPTGSVSGLFERDRENGSTWCWLLLLRVHDSVSSVGVSTLPEPRGGASMLSDQQRQTALKKNIEYARATARDLLADGVEEITLTHYADEEAFRAMKLPEQGDDFEFQRMVNAEFAKVMVAHGLQVKVQVLDAKEYFEWLGSRPNTYQAQQEYPGGRHASGDEAMALLGIK